MQMIRSVKSMQSAIRRLRTAGKKIGFVPTMGALHEGHLSLVRRARRENEVVVLSIFVNPAQFSPREDFKAYPRQEKEDKLLAKREKVDIIFYPSEHEMYPPGCLTHIDVDKIAGILCGKSRPGHFRGVATVVGKLLNSVMPDTVYFGQKDAQQAVVLKQMIRDLNFPVAVKVCPIVRGHDGLALSSRNLYLSDRQRREALVLSRGLKEAKKKIVSGERNAQKVIRTIRKKIAARSSGRIDYVACVDADTLEPLKKLKGNILIALAVYFGKTRLIDNIVFRL